MNLMEEVEYLRNQMTREQIRCPGPWDAQLKKREERRIRVEKVKKWKCGKVT